MGDRISIQFENRNKKSVVLFSHWQGQDLLETVREYLKELKKYQKTDKGTFPLGRRETGTVLVDFIRFLTKDETHIRSDFYIAKDEFSGDNSDNGHYLINLQDYTIEEA